MSGSPVSIIISCFNYERFVADAISSALGQTHEVEVVVVDDGSQDSSLREIGAFGDRVVVIAKANGGQASALNAGFRACRGDPVIFLDADDVLLKTAASSVSSALSDPGIAKAHWSMPVIDQEGRLTGEVQDEELVEGDLREHVRREGPLGEDTLGSPPMSGNAFSRGFLEQVMPIPEPLYRTGADEYLFALAPAFGPIVRLAPQSLYRIHGGNDHSKWSFERMLVFQQAHHRAVSRVIAEAYRRQGFAYDERAWRRSAWPLRTARVVEAIDASLPPQTSFALLDGAALGLDRDLRGRSVIPFPEARGEFAGYPADEAEAVGELERLTAAGIRYFVLAWPAFWWMDEYPALAAALQDRHTVVASDADVVVFGPCG